MGQGQSKDSAVNLFIQLSEDIFLAGQWIQGVVYIDAKTQRNYSVLRMTLTGIEHVYFEEDEGKFKKVFENNKKIYDHSFDLAKFSDGVLPAGQYAFPFKLLLPSQMVGSYYESDKFFIGYKLQAQLVPFMSQHESLKFGQMLNILEPLRQNPGPIIKKEVTVAVCCACCLTYGTVLTLMMVDRNIIKSGDEINVELKFDNTKGQTSIKNIELKFKDKKWYTSERGDIRSQIFTDHTLYSDESIQILPGQTKEFKIKTKIPIDLPSYSTAIGSALARYQYLSLQTSMGCCTFSPHIELFLVFHSLTQPIKKPDAFDPPPGWNPVYASEMINNNLAPFYYQPNLGLKFRNRKGETNSAVLKQMAMNASSVSNDLLYNDIVDITTTKIIDSIVG